MTMSDSHFFEPRAGHGLAHDPINAIVAPRPIGWISSMSVDGVANLAPYSYFNIFCNRPPIIGFSSSGRKDSLTNIEATGEFVWNLATRDMAQAMNLSSVALAPDIDEFAFAGVDKAPARMVAPPRVAGSLVQFECRVTQILRLADAGGTELNNWLVLGEAVGVHIDRAMIVDGSYSTVRAGAIGRAGGTGDYFEATPSAYFHMPRPPSAD